MPASRMARKRPKSAAQRRSRPRSASKEKRGAKRGKAAEIISSLCFAQKRGPGQGNHGISWPESLVALAMDSKHNSPASYTYAEAGVSIETGNALVRAIAPLARATRRPGADADLGGFGGFFDLRSEEHTSDLQSLMRTSYAVFCLK